MNNKEMKEKTVLLLSSRYGISNSANAVCAKNIANEFKSRGYKVVVLTSSGNNNDVEFVEDGVKVYAIRQSWYSKLLSEQNSNKSRISKLLFRIVSLFRRGINIFLYPNVAPIRSTKVLNKAMQIIKLHGVSVVISTYRPYENIYSAINISKALGDTVSVFDFQLDVLFEANLKSSFIKTILRSKANRTIIKETRYLKRVILPESAESIYNGKHGICFAGFPVYVPNLAKKESQFEYDKKFINITYIGSLSIENRNPLNAFMFIAKINEHIIQKCLIHLWGNINTELRTIIDRYDFVVYHGMIDNEYTMDLLQKSDYLLNISNQMTYSMLPSKIFQEFAAKRPIINFIKNRADVSITFFDKYGYSINIYEEDIDKLDIDKIANRITELKGQKISIPSDLLAKYTPSYFVDIIERDLK